MNYRCILLCGLCLWFSVCSGQNNTKIYDLLNELKVTTQDTSKADIFVRLANEYYPTEVDKAITKSELALMMMESRKDTRRVFNTLEILIRCHVDVKSNLDAAAKYLSKIRSLDAAQLNRLDNAKIFSLEGKVYLALNDCPKSQKAFFQELEILQSLGVNTPKVELATAYFNLGELYFFQNDFQNAITNYIKSLEIFQQTNTIEGRVKTLNALGRVYSVRRDYEKSLQYCNDALFLSESLWDKTLIGNTYITSGIALNGLERKDEAVVNLEKAIEIGNTINSQLIVARGKIALGAVYENTPKDTATIRLYREALDAVFATKDKALTRDVYEKLYLYYDKKDNADFAYLYLKNLVAARDSLNIEEQSKQIIISKIRFEAEQKEQENQRLLAKQLESQTTIQLQKLGNIVLFVLMILLSIAGHFLYKSLKQKRQNNQDLEVEVEKRTKMLLASNEELLSTNKRLEQSNNELERFAYIASHDLKSPLRNIISFLNLIQRKLRSSQDTDLQEYLRFATENAKQMHVLIQDVLEFSKVDSVPDTKKEKIDMNESIMLVVQNLQEAIKETNAEILTDTLPTIEGNSVQILQLLQNLVGNGIKYNKNHLPKVEITHNRVNGHHIFAIKDNGIGISQEYHDQIFEMFKRLHTRDEYKGTGIGLAICKKIVNNFGGRIWLDSNFGQGSIFYFTIPT